MSANEPTITAQTLGELHDKLGEFLRKRPELRALAFLDDEYVITPVTLALHWMAFDTEGDTFYVDDENRRRFAPPVQYASVDIEPVPR